MEDNNNGEQPPPKKTNIWNPYFDSRNHNTSQEPKQEAEASQRSGEQKASRQRSQPQSPGWFQMPPSAPPGAIWPPPGVAPPQLPFGMAHAQLPQAWLATFANSRQVDFGPSALQQTKTSGRPSDMSLKGRLSSAAPKPRMPAMSGPSGGLGVILGEGMGAGSRRDAAGAPLVGLLGQNCCAHCGSVFRLTSDLVAHVRSHHRSSGSEGSDTSTSARKRKHQRADDSQDDDDSDFEEDDD